MAERTALAPVDSPLTALVGGTVMTATGEVIEDGVVVMEDGVIVAVGARDAVEVPVGAREIDVTGRFVTPGLIDTHSHMGVYPSPHVRATADGNEMSDPTTPEVRAADAFWPQDPQILSTDGAHGQRNLRQEAGNAVATGLPRDVALRALTLEPARVFGVDDQYGTLAPGRVANLVVWTGDPFELTTWARHVFIRGREIPTTSRQSLLFDRYRRLEDVPRGQRGLPRDESRTR